jgi:predicted nuclease of predicted toxin-antitoxin system
MPEVQYLADMNISPFTVEELRQNGLHVIRLSEIMDSRTKDIDILDYARRHNKVIITQDLDY